MESGQCHDNSKESTFLLSRQLQTNFLNIYTIQGFWASWAVCGMQRCALTTKFVYRQGLGTCDALLCVAHTLQSALEMGRRLGWFRSASMSLLTGSTIKGLSSAQLWGSWSSVLSVLTQFLSNWSHYVVVDGCRCTQVNVVSEVPHWSILGLQLFLFTRGAFLNTGKQAFRLCWRLIFGSCCAIPWWESSLWVVF